MDNIIKNYKFEGKEIKVLAKFKDYCIIQRDTTSSSFIVAYRPTADE